MNVVKLLCESHSITLTFLKRYFNHHMHAKCLVFLSHNLSNLTKAKGNLRCCSNDVAKLSRSEKFFLKSISDNLIPNQVYTWVFSLISLIEILSILNYFFATSDSYTLFYIYIVIFLKFIYNSINIAWLTSTTYKINWKWFFNRNKSSCLAKIVYFWKGLKTFYLYNI